jgi:uncharacterized protein (DUF58 family)
VIPVPTRRLAVVALVLAAVRLVLPDDLPGGLVALNAALVVVALADWALAVRPGAVWVERVVAAVVPLGAEAPVQWRLTNTTDRTVRCHVADELAPSLRPSHRRFRVALPPRGSGTVEATLRPTRRGRFAPTELVVRVAGPLGLASRQEARRLPGVVRVYPPFRSRDEAELRIERARILEVGLRSAKGRGAGTDFDQLRDYGPDDDHRRIDWSATARTQRTIVRTYRAERNQTIVLLLDNGRVMAGRVGGVPRVEHAMDAVMCVATVATRLGDRCGLVAFDRRVRTVVAPSAGREQVGRVTEAMYDLEPELYESDYRSAFATTIARFRRRSMLVVLTDLVEQVVGETLLPALPLVARNHLVVVGAVQDPAVLAWAHGEAADAEAAYRKAAAVEALAARARSTVRLRAFGAIVVDAPPGRLAPMLTDAYLHAKAVGRL